jgi:CRP/FNR family transcriptional regulator, dissimilatory nitrate respiration regulator
MNLSLLNQLPTQLQSMIALKDLAAGQVLFAQQETADAVFILESGYIQLLNYTEDGQQVNHYRVRAGESFAEVALFYDQYVCTAIAHRPSRVLVVPKQPYLALLRSEPDTAIALVMRLAQRLHENKILLELRSIRSAHKRVLHYLHLNVQTDGSTVDLRFPLKEIADDLGLTPEALSRTLKRLQREGTISRVKRKITLRNKTCDV